MLPAGQPLLAAQGEVGASGELVLPASIKILMGLLQMGEAGEEWVEAFASQAFVLSMDLCCVQENISKPCNHENRIGEVQSLDSAHSECGHCQLLAILLQGKCAGPLE